MPNLLGVREGRIMTTRTAFKLTWQAINSLSIDWLVKSAKPYLYLSIRDDATSASPRKIRAVRLKNT